MSFCFGGWSDLNRVKATVRWTVAAEGLTEANNYFCPWAKMQTNLAGTFRISKVIRIFRQLHAKF